MKIDNGFIHCSASRGADGLLQLDSLANNKTGYDWAAPGHSWGINIGFGGETAEQHQAWQFTGACDGVGTGAQQDCTATFEHSSGLSAAHAAGSAAGYAALCLRCTVTNKGSSAVCGLTNISPLRMSLKTRPGLLVHTIRRDKYCLETTPVGHEPIVIAGGLWNRVEHAGWLALEDRQAQECLFIGIQWEREWELKLTPAEDHIAVEFSLVSYGRSLEAGETAESPRVLVGLAHGGLDELSNHMRGYMTAFVFPPKLQNFPWVSYDIWSTDSSDVEQKLQEEMDFAAGLGVDLFYIDASWWAGSSVKGGGAWGLGLGCYEEDRRKFPHGLRSLSDRAHGLGMKFGLWVDPMVVDAGHVDSGLIPSAWLVQKDGVDSELRIGQEDWPPVRQLCTGCPQVREYLIEKLSGLVAKFNLDWLKWDDSALAMPHCNRTDHGHGSGDGNYEALKGKYAICAALNERFPELVIEQCGYPARLDYGLAPYVRSNWLSDASTPSVHVRNNMEVACYIYPASYNAAWILRDEETLHEADPDIVDSIVRSRMMGLFGLGTLTGQLSERISLLPQPIIDGIRRNVPHYKRFRHLLSQNVWHLNPYQRHADDWQAMAFSSMEGGQAVAMIFRGGSGNETGCIRLKGLDANAEYCVESVNTSQAYHSLGHSLIEDGVTVVLAKKEMSEIILVTRL